MNCSSRKSKGLSTFPFDHGCPGSDRVGFMENQASGNNSEIFNPEDYHRQAALLRLHTITARRRCCSYTQQPKLA